MGGESAGVDVLAAEYRLKWGDKTTHRSVDDVDDLWFRRGLSAVLTMLNAGLFLDPDGVTLEPQLLMRGGVLAFSYEQVITACGPARYSRAAPPAWI